MEKKDLVIGGWCNLVPPDSRCTFAGSGYRPRSKSTNHSVIAFHLRDDGSCPKPWKRDPSNTHQISIAYSSGHSRISLFQAQMAIPPMRLCTPDRASFAVALFAVRRLTDCIEPYARFLTLEQREMHPETDTDFSGHRTEEAYRERVQVYWSRVIAIKLQDLIRSDGLL